MSDSESIVDLWHARTEGRPVTCAGRCKRPGLALTIGEMYRWSCVTCGWMSAWFTVARGSVRSRSQVRVVVETPRSWAASPKETLP